MRRKKILRLAAILLLIYIAFGVLLYFGQNRLIFFPSSVVNVTPAMVNLSYEDLWITVAENKLHSWWIASVKPRGPVVLYLHGNGSNLGDLLHQAQIFHQLGFSLLLIDYRGYGKSQGDFPDETSVYEDAEAAWVYLTTQKKIMSQEIFVYGHSLGGAIAINLAQQHQDLAGVIVESSFTSISAMLDFVFPFPLYPKKWILTQHFDSLSKVASLFLPVLFIHGTGDSVVPFSMSKELYEAAPDPKYLVLIPGAGHDNIAAKGGEKYRQEISSFVKTYFRG